MSNAKVSFSGARLRLARRIFRRTQASLASALRIDPAIICRAERGTAPSTDVVHALAEVLGVAPSFFYHEARTQLFDEEIHFRRRSSATLMDLQQALAHSSLFVELVQFLEGHVEFPPDRIPRIQATTPEQIEEAAGASRTAMGLPANGGLDNVVRALENAGIVVAILGGYADKVDAFSANAPTGRKFVFLNAEDPPSRTAFNAAHELGHLVLHRDREIGDKDQQNQTESEADMFASAFLLPRHGFTREFQRGRVDWSNLFRLKERWHVSLAALIRRARDLELIGPTDYMNAYKYLSYKNWRRQEPGEFAMPRAELVHQALTVVEEHAELSFFDVARALKLAPSTLAVVAGVPLPEVAASTAEVVSLAAHRLRQVTTDD